MRDPWAIVEVKAVNQGTGRWPAEVPSVRVAIGETAIRLTPNQTRRMIRKLEEALVDCEYRRRMQGGS